LPLSILVKPVAVPYLGYGQHVAFDRELYAVVTGSYSELTGQSMPQRLGAAYSGPGGQAFNDSQNPYLYNQWQSFGFSQRRWRDFDSDCHVGDCIILT
jgi:hypothetical protein